MSNTVIIITTSQFKQDRRSKRRLPAVLGNVGFLNGFTSSTVKKKGGLALYYQFQFILRKKCLSIGYLKPSFIASFAMYGFLTTSR